MRLPPASLLLAMGASASRECGKISKEVKTLENREKRYARFIPEC